MTRNTNEIPIIMKSLSSLLQKACNSLQNNTIWDFSGSSVVKRLHFHCREYEFGSIPGKGTKIPHVMPCGQNK